MPEEEVLSVIDVPSGKMGRVIGRRGASILSIKESCKYVSLLHRLMCAYVRIKTHFQFPEHYFNVQLLGLNNTDNMMIPSAPMCYFPLLFYIPLFKFRTNASCIERMGKRG